DADFIEYYKQKNIIVDSIQYSEKQYQKALQVFQSGKGALLPMVRKRYFEDIKQHYVQKMENILEIEEPDYKDYYAFSQAFSAIAGDYGLDYDSADYVLYDSITSDKFDKYDKRKVMQHLLEIAKKWK
ncbi:MAG TPA: hypothetical protein VFR70_08455, partial [Flavobacterium sp.]|nr:hypothetical protein [Flavobacterium sp.]